MTHSRLKYTIILAWPLLACNARQEETGTQAAPGSADGDPSVVHHPEPPARAEQKRDSMQIEGTWSPFTARLVKPNTDIAFSAYLPERMEFDQAASGEGEGFYFYSTFSGSRNENAFVLVFMPPQGATEADVRRLGDAFVASRRNTRQVANYRPGNHQGRHFYMAYTYPAEFGDGMAPRIGYITQQWIWLNDGRSLESTLGSLPE